MAIRFLKNISIRQRLTYIIMTISSASVLLTTVAISVIGVVNLENDIKDELNLSASIVGDRNIAALNYDSYDSVESSLNVFSVNQQIIHACIYDAVSNIDVTSNQASSELRMDQAVGQYPARVDNTAQCPTDLRVRAQLSDRRIEILKEIIDAKNGKVGYIYIESTLEQIDQYIQKQSIIALAVIAAALLLSYLLAINLQNAISRPILRLAYTAKQISEHKDYNIRAQRIGDSHTEFKNELVILTDAFNEMLSEISTRDRQLKKQNIDLEKAKDEAEGANRAKSQFLANISHELRTPLNAIIGFSSILMNQLFGPLGDKKYLEYAKDINDSGAHLLDIINDILDLSKAEAGKLTLTYEEVHIAKSVNKCMTIMAERAEKGKITVTVDVAKTLPPLVADRLRFIQILLNIISNAIKFSQEGGRVHISAHTLGKEGAVTHFVITVQDTGIGMSPEDLHKAFQSFGQADSGLNRKYEGTGLGLPLTRKLVELHHGKIEMESELGKGTIVRLIFPALPPPEAGYVPNE